MSSSDRPRFFCTSCGNESLKWEGRCPACGDWNTMAEAPDRDAGGKGSGGGPPRPAEAGRREPRPLREMEGEAAERRATGIGELDVLLGGGLVPGSLVLLGGPPGIGKSTLLLQIAAKLQSDGGRVLYVSGEESADQVRMRADRLGSGASDVTFLPSTDADRIVDEAAGMEPELLCVDSIQTLTASGVESSAGNVAQVRECAARLQTFAKETDTPTFLVGHVTKGGGLAGPRTLEHAVDVVLQFEGERSVEHRILRASKNRFGSVDELAVFRMTSLGLEPVENPSELFLEDRPRRVSGSAVAVPLHGTRPLLAEVQALTGPSQYSNPQRVATGFPSRRLSMLLTVLERRADLSLAGADVFINVVGGLSLTDPAVDLAVLAALASSELDRPLPADLAFFGEVGLGGETRSVARSDSRLSEVRRSGLTGAAVPEAVAESVDAEGLELRPVKRIHELVAMMREDGE